MFAFLFMNTAFAATVSGGIQVAAFPGALDFASELLTDQTLMIDEPEFSGTDVACYDTVGIRDLNAEVPLDRVELKFNDDTLIVDIHFGEIHGEDMLLFGSDEDLWDVCPSFETTINSLTLYEGRLLAEFAAFNRGGDFELKVIGTPTFTGDIESDIDWIPDDLVLTFVEDSIFETVEEMIVEEVPELVKDLLGNSLYAGEIGNIELDVQLADVQMENSLMIGMDVAAGWNGEGCPVTGVLSEPEGSNPSVQFNASTDSDIGIAVTEYQINRLFFGAWEDGLLCFEAGPLYAAIEAVEALMGDTIPNSGVELSFNRAPQFNIDETGMSMTIDGLHLGVYGEVDGEQKVIVGLDAAVTLDTELQIDHELSSFVFNLTNVDLELNALVADPLINDRQGVSDRLIGFLEGWAMDTLAARIADVPIYGNLFELSGMFLRVDELQAADGAVRIYGSLYDLSDPDVDTVAPDTEATIAKATAKTIRLAWSAEDNSNGPFAYSWRLDSGSWSYWTADAGDSFPTPEPGTHIVEVRARDAWLNTDPSPKAIVFNVPEPKPKKACGCSTGSPSLNWLTWVLGALFVGARRRQD